MYITLCSISYMATSWYFNMYNAVHRHEQNRTQHVGRVHLHIAIPEKHIRIRSVSTAHGNFGSEAARDLDGHLRACTPFADGPGAAAGDAVFRQDSRNSFGNPLELRGFCSETA